MGSILELLNVKEWQSWM